MLAEGGRLVKQKKQQRTTAENQTAFLRRRSDPRTLDNIRSATRSARRSRAVNVLATRRATANMARARPWHLPFSCAANLHPICTVQRNIHTKRSTLKSLFLSWIESCGPRGPHGCPRAPAIRLCETTTPLVRPVCYNFVGHLRDTAAKPRGRLPDRAAARDCRRVVPTLCCRAPCTCVSARAACTTRRAQR
jgi:hypothetical protein